MDAGRPTSPDRVGERGRARRPSPSPPRIRRRSPAYTRGPWATARRSSGPGCGRATRSARATAGCAQGAASATGRRTARPSRTRPSGRGSTRWASHPPGPTSGSRPTRTATSRPSGTTRPNRKQYLYHPTWRERHDKNKYRRMLLLAEALPGARGTVRRHLRDAEEPRRQVLAAAFRMLDLGGLRIGSTAYEEQNGSYGLTTLHGEHVTVHGDDGRAALPREEPQACGSRRCATRTSRRCSPAWQRRGAGERLLAYHDGGRWHTIAPEDVNAYVRKRLHGEFSAKDFRTIRGTVAAAVSLAKHGPEDEAGPRRSGRSPTRCARRPQRCRTRPPVAKASYVDPRVVDRYRAGETIDPDRACTPRSRRCSRCSSSVPVPRSRSRSRSRTAEPHRRDALEVSRQRDGRSAAVRGTLPR